MQLTKLIETAIDNYRNATPDQRATLELIYGKDTFKGCVEITDRIKTFGDACDELGISVSSIISKLDTPDETAYKKVKVIVKALNEGWTPNWDDSNENKYYPWFNRSSSPGFSFGDFAYGYSTSTVGSRLCFKSRELAKYAAEQFTDIYKDFFN